MHLTEATQVATQVATPIDVAVGRLDAWLETMRGLGGYGGPVVHWWQHCLTYTGAGLDWRYEGIIAGYLQLWTRTGDVRWLTKARRAGDDLIAGQAADGHFVASAFENNPANGGTPHEAAADVGLLLLSRALRCSGAGEWQVYADAAEHNLRSFFIDQLWDAETCSFRDKPRVPSFVPNKAATVCEALFLLAEVSGDDEWVVRYALPTLGHVLHHQQNGAGPLDGAIAQNSDGTRRVEKYFPLYIARCVPALSRGYLWSNDERYLDAAIRAMRFIARWAYHDGSIPTVIYANRRVSRYPSWVAPLAEVLRAADEIRPYGFDADLGAMLARLLDGQDQSGGIQTATGFAAQTGGSAGTTPDVRDVLHVVGWCDKAFRYLSMHTGKVIPASASTTIDVACTFQGKTMRLIETPEVLEVSHGNVVCYRWRKGEPWAEIATPKFWLR